MQRRGKWERMFNNLSYSHWVPLIFRILVKKAVVIKFLLQQYQHLLSPLIEVTDKEHPTLAATPELPMMLYQPFDNQWPIIPLAKGFTHFGS